MLVQHEHKLSVTFLQFFFLKSFLPVLVLTFAIIYINLIYNLLNECFFDNILLWSS